MAKKKPLLTDGHKTRVGSGESFVEYDRLIIWSDESTFNLFGSGERVYVRRRVGEEYLSQCIQQRVKFSRGMG